MTSAGNFASPLAGFSIVPNGIDTDRFYPLPGIERDPCRLIVTNSSDIALKGLHVLLRAIAELVPILPKIKLVVVGNAEEEEPHLQIDF